MSIFSSMPAFSAPDSTTEEKSSMKDSSKEVPIAKTGEVFPWQNIRLPKFVFPIQYKLHIQPDLTTFKCTGSVKVSLKVTNETNFIIFNCKDLVIKSTSVSIENSNKELPVVKVLECLKTDQIYLEVNGVLKPGEIYCLFVTYEKQLKEELEGFYISSYKASDGTKRYLATTNFEPTYARMAFPCFDEPALKASFQLSIVHKDNFKVYFNTDIEQSVSNGDGTSTTLFQKTVKMSTYLVAFIICDFAEIQQQSEDGLKVRVIAPADQIDQAEFALKTALKVLPYYQHLFGIKYPLSKLDLVAIPDFSCGAMENWGLITFRSVQILYKPFETSSVIQEHIGTTIAHELAHQWFGNLVTMEWWNDLWLNEGFASFVEFLGTDYAYPEWNMMNQFIVSTTQHALSQDSLETSHAIMATVNDPSEIESIFDDISYTKGASILYMLQDALGMNVMQEALKLYLDRYQFKNAKTEDLWNTWTEVSMKTHQMDVAKLMDTWSRQKGYPLLRATMSKDGTISVSQQRFMLVSSSSSTASISDSPFGYKWIVPVTYFTSNDKERKMFWLNSTEGQFSVPPNNKWIKLNINQAGFYRVMYDKSMWLNLINQMLTDHEVFSAADRSCLLDDAFTLARVGLLESGLALDLSKYLEKEREFAPWTTALAHFEYLHSMMEDSAVVLLVEKYVLKLLKPIIQLLGWKDEGSHLTRRLRSIVLTTSLHYKDEETIRETKKMFNNWMNNGESVPSNLRRVVYHSGIKHGGKEEWQFCWKKYQESVVPSEKRTLLSALGQTQYLWQLTEFLNNSLDKNKIRPQDTTSVITLSSLNPIGQFLTWRFVRMNWATLVDMFGHTTFNMDYLISAVISSFKTRFDYDEAKSFFSYVNIFSGMQALQQSLERIQANIQWKDNVESSITQWLEQNVS